MRSIASRWFLAAVIVVGGLLVWSAHDLVAPPVASADEGATAQADDDPVVIRFFYGDGCPYCAQEERELDVWESELDVEVHRYEVWNDEDNRELYAELAAAYAVEPRGVPATFIGPWVWMGFNEELAAEMRAAVDACSGGACDDPMTALGSAGSEGSGPETDAADPDAADPEAADPDAADPEAAEDPIGPAPWGPTAASDGETSAAEPSAPTSVQLPFVGTVELTDGGVLASTALIAFVDGFNPCSLWVLSILLALLVRTGSRLRIAALGGAFLGVTALIYGAFIAGAFGTLSYVSHLGWIRLVVAGFALVFAVVSIKDYVALKQGPSFTIPDAAKPRIYRRSRRIADVDSSLPVVLGATVVMAAGVALVELPCTAGFPVVWSQVVHDAGVSGGRFGGLLGVYLGIYLLDEVAVLAAVLITMRVSKVQERHVEVLKLVGGTIMLALGGVMLVEPELLHDLTGTLAVFLSAVAVAVLVHTTRRLVTR